MKQAEAMKLVNTLIIGLQRARSVSKESLEDLVIDGKVISKQVVINVLEGLTPWLHGPKGDGFLCALMVVSNRGTVTGMDMYNFMTIIHLLNPTVAAMAGILTDTTFPEPDIHWCAGLEK